MAKKKPIQYNKKANILIYDDENIKYYQGISNKLGLA